MSHKGCGFLFFMRLKINGETVDNLKACTVGELLEELKIRTGRVAVEVNLTVVRRQEFETFMLNNDDAVEIVNFVGGG